MLFREHTPQRRDNIEEKKNYRDYRIPLREDFNYRCGYCDDRDFPRVEYFEIDHLIPQKIMKVKKDNDYKNLVYACHSCNNAKRAKWPWSATRSLRTGWPPGCTAARAST